MARWPRLTRISEADSHKDWRIDPSSALGPPVVRKGGDMARILGLSDKVWEYTQKLKLPYGKRTLLPDDDYIETFDKPGQRDPDFRQFADPGLFLSPALAACRKRCLDTPQILWL